jgi:general secretion pathway protein L
MKALIAQAATAATARLRAFFAWWLGELAGMLPAGLGALLRRGGQRVVLELAGGRIEVLHRVRGRNAVLGSVDLAADHDAHGTLAALLRAARLQVRPGGSSVPVCLRLADAHPLGVTLPLPLAAEENLRDAILFELDRAIPLRSSEVCFGYAVNERDRAARRLVVGVVVVRKSAVDAALAQLAAIGVVPDRVVVAGSGEAPDCDLHLDRAAPRTTARRRRLRLALGLVAVALGVYATILPIRRAERREAVLDQRVAAATRAVDAAQRLRRRIAASDAASRFLLDRKRTTPPLSVVLAALARILPDDTWVEELRIREHDVRLTGFSHASSSLIGLLEASPLFHDTRFAAPTTRDSQTGVENFSISTRIRSGIGR